MSVAARNQQDEWYKWQTHAVWADFWDWHAPQWRRPLEQVQRDLAALTRALTDFARQDVEDFNRRSAELYRKRVGVSYLLPAGTGRMEQFHQQVVRRLLEQYARDGPDSASTPPRPIWCRRWSAPTPGPRRSGSASSQTPEHAVSFLRERVEDRGQEVPAGAAAPVSSPCCPGCRTCWSEAAGHGHGPGPAAMQDYLDEFRGKLAGLLPANFTPQGSGPLKLLVNYPADAPSEIVKGYLKSAINLPVGPRIAEDCTGTPRTESISVVLVPHRRWASPRWTKSATCCVGEPAC